MVSRLIRFGSSASRGLFGVVIRQRHHGDDFAGAHVEDDTGRGVRLELVARRHKLVAQRVLDPQIDRKPHRLLFAIGAEAGAMEIGEAVAVEPFLQPGNALIVDIDVADDVGDLVAIGVDALVLAEEANPRNAEAIHLLLLHRGDLALEPGEAAFRSEPVADLAAVEVRQHAGKKLGRLVRVDDAPRLGEQGGRAQIGGQESRHLRSRMSGRAVAAASCTPSVSNRVSVGKHRIKYEAQRDDAVY